MLEDPSGHPDPEPALAQRSVPAHELTEHGERLLRRTGGILPHDAWRRGEFDGLQKCVSARLVVGAFPTAVARLLPTAVATFRETVPAR